MRKHLLTLLAVALLLVLAACGGNNNNANENANSNNNTEVNEEATNENAEEEVNEVEEIDLSTLDGVSAADILAEDPEADIFQYEGIVYQTEGELAEDAGVTVKELIGKVTKKVDANTDFEDGMATMLFPNVKIYSTNETDLTTVLVEVQDKLIVYHAQINE